MTIGKFLKLSSNYLKARASNEPYYWSWCTWTTFGRIRHKAGYWAAPLPLEEDLLEDRTVDGGIWQQSFEYDDFAHFVIPRFFSWESVIGDEVKWHDAEQDIAGLSVELQRNRIPHRKNDLLLEWMAY